MSGSMNWLDDYQTWQQNVLRLPVSGFQDKADQFTSINYYLTGFVAEAGESLGELVKVIGNQKTPEEGLDALHKELGDSLFFLIALLQCLGVTLEEILQMNREKLNARFNLPTDVTL